MAAAAKTFSSSPALPLDDVPSSHTGSFDGRRRLRGAWLIDIDRIKPDPAQPRKVNNTAAQEEFNATVSRLGILQPITVRFIEKDNVYRIITGERRFRAAKQAGLGQIPCWVQEPNDQDVLLHQIVENWHRCEMHPYDLADALARMRDENGYNQKQIAQQTGKSEGEISKLLALLILDADVQKTAREDSTGRITKKHLYTVIGLEGEDQRRLIGKVQNEGLTTTELKKHAQRASSTHTQQKRPGAPVKQARFNTTSATVTVTFRRQNVTDDDIIAALDEARALAADSNRNSSE